MNLNAKNILIESFSSHNYSPSPHPTPSLSHQPASPTHVSTEVSAPTPVATSSNASVHGASEESAVRMVGSLEHLEGCPLLSGVVYILAAAQLCGYFTFENFSVSNWLRRFSFKSKQTI